MPATAPTLDDLHHCLDVALAAERDADGALTHSGEADIMHALDHAGLLPDNGGEKE